MEQSSKQAAVRVDIRGQRVAHTYAEALYEAAAKRGQQEAILEEATSLLDDVFAADPRIEALITSGVVGRHARADILAKGLKQHASELFYNFLCVLNKHERLELLRPIVAEMRQINDSKKGRVHVKVVSAVAIPEDQQQSLTDRLRASFAIEPVLDMKVDSSLLGGVKIRIGDWQYDASVRTRLDNIRQLILARSSHEIQSGRDRFSSDS